MTKLLAIWKLLNPMVWLGLAVAAVVTLALLWWILIGGPAHDRRAAASARAGRIEAQAQAGAGKDAVTIVTGQASRDAATDHQTQENHDAITSAPGAAAAVDPGVDAAGRRAICLRHAYRCTATCVRLLGPCAG